MSYLGLIAFVTGILGVWLTIKQNIYCWPFALTAVVCATIDFYRGRLYGDMSLQVFYFFAGVYGWIYWEKHSKTEFTVRRMEMKWWPILVGITVLQFAVYYYLLRYFHGTRPALDAALTALSLTCTYMMTKKWVENWFLWIWIDAFYVVLFITTEWWWYAAQSVVFTIAATYGWIRWRKLA